MLSRAETTASENTVLNDRDIWATANIMIKRFGEDAVIEACMRADALAEEGDFVGVTVWLTIIRSIEFLSDQMASGAIN